MVLLDKIVQPLVQPSKLAGGTNENDLTWKVSQVVKIIPLVIIIQLVKISNQLYGSNQLKSSN